MVRIPSIKNKAPDTLSRHPTGDHHPPKMVLHDDLHSIQDHTNVPPLSNPTSLITGVCIEDHTSSLQIEDQLQDSLISSLHSTHTVTCKMPQHQTAICSSSCTPLKMVSLSPNTRHHYLSENTTSFGNTSPAVMALPSTKTAHHHPTMSTAILPICPTCCSPRHINHDVRG